MPIEKLWVSYESPQESGNRTEVKHVALSGSGDDKDTNFLAKLSFGEQEGCSFGASHYRVEDIGAAGYPYELEKKRRDEIIVRLAWRHMALVWELVDRTACLTTS